MRFNHGSQVEGLDVLEQIVPGYSHQDGCDRKLWKANQDIRSEFAPLTRALRDLLQELHDGMHEFPMAEGRNLRKATDLRQDESRDNFPIRSEKFVSHPVGKETKYCLGR